MNFYSYVPANILDRVTPSQLPQIPGIECFSQSERSARSARDFYDLRSVATTELVALSGTLNPEGPVSPVVLPILQTCLHSLCRHQAELTQVNTEMNRVLCDIAPDKAYAAVFSAHIDAARHLLHYVNAGDHIAMILRGNGAVERIPTNAAVFGLSNRSVYRQRSIHFEPGDSLITASDGIAEAESPNGAKFAQRVLLQILREHLGARFRDLPGDIMSAVRAFTGTARAAMDRTVIVAHFSHQNAMAMAA